LRLNEGKKDLAQNLPIYIPFLFLMVSIGIFATQTNNKEINMKRKYLNKSVLILCTVFILGSGSYAFAQWGMGYGHHGGPQHGYGRHHHDYGGPGYGYRGNLSEAELKKIEEEHNAFFETTRELRQKIYQKRLELLSELAKKDPDAEKAAGLQKEISELKGHMGQKRLDHILKMKKINPDIGRGLMDRGRMGFGMMGPKGYGGCPNYPSPGYGSGYEMGPGMMGPGYRMGPGMMGPGMMGPGMMGSGMMGSGMMGSGVMGSGVMGSDRGRGMMPGWPGYDDPEHNRQGKGPLEEKDAGTIVANYIKSTRNPNLETGKVKDVGEAFEVEIVTKDKSLVDKVLVDKRSGWIRSTY
jgi:hypothetical protein